MKYLCDLSFLFTRIALTLAAVTWSDLAYAGDSSNAEALFDKGLDAMRAGHYETGCPMLQESYRLEPLPGVLFTLAECEAAWGKLSTAIAHYRSFLSTLTSLPAGRRDSFEERRKVALEKLASITATMPEITVDVPASGRSALVVKRNGTLIETWSFGITQKVDPGEYAITAQSEGGGQWERRITLGERDRARVDVPWPLPATSTTEPAPPASPAPSHAADDSGHGGSRTWVYVTGAIGIASLATGAVAGFLAIANKSTVDANCPAHLCNAEGQRAVDAGRSSALVSSVAIPVGVIGIGTATALLMMSSGKSDASKTSSREVHPSIVGTTHGVSLSLEGRF